MWSPSCSQSRSLSPSDATTQRSVQGHDAIPSHSTSSNGSVDIRYIDMHRLKGEGNIYCISILENFSRAILTSAITRRQDTEAFVSVLYHAIRKFGVPTILVSDNGGVFLSHDVRKIYDSLGIEKKEIKEG